MVGMAPVKCLFPDLDGHVVIVDTVLRLHEPGTPFWISREEYILFGSHQLTESGPVEQF